MKDEEAIAKYYEDSFYNMLDKVIERTERELPEDGDFAPIYEEFGNIDESLRGIKRYRLKVFKMPTVDVSDTKKRYVMAAVYSDWGYMANVLVACGYKDEILETLKSKDFPTKLNDAFLDLTEMLQREM